PSRRRPVAPAHGGRRDPALRDADHLLPPDRDARHRDSGRADRGRRPGGALVSRRQLRRGRLRRPAALRRRPRAEPARHVRARRAALLPRLLPRAPRDQDPARGDPRAERPLRAHRAAGPAELELRQRLQVAARAGRVRTLKGGRMATVAAPTAVEPLYLAGEWVNTEDSFEVRSPYSGAVVATVARAGAGEARRAIDAAERAMHDPLPTWPRADR